MRASKQNIQHAATKVTFVIILSFSASVFDDFRVLPQIPSTLILIHRNPATARSYWLQWLRLFVLDELNQKPLA